MRPRRYMTTALSSWMVPASLARTLTAWSAPVITICILSVPYARAQEPYCAFEVHVATPAGKPVPGVPVAMLRADKTTYSNTASGLDGVARICDAPLQTVNFVVGFDICGSVMVRNLRPAWPETQQVIVTYASAPCPHMTFCNECQVLLRIRDENGNPVAGARFQGTPSGLRGSAVSDEFGRLFRVVRRGETLKGIVAKQGKASAQVSVLVDDDVEFKVVLPTR